MNSNSANHEVFTFESVRKGAKALGILEGNRIRVLKGSWPSRRSNRSMPMRYQNLRQELISQKIISPDKYGQLYFNVDYVFANPSEAACVIQGGSRNGFDCWKDAAGRSLKERGLVKF